MAEPAPIAPEDARDARLVARQIGRAPRDPWRVSSRCVYGYPQVIASPAVLDDGTPFPTVFWLTCPHLVDCASNLESRGELARWQERIDADPSFAAELMAAAREFARLRASETPKDALGGCADVGIAGQREPSAAKCIHARIAVALEGVADPIGRAAIATCGSVCGDMRCVALEGDDA